MRNGWILLLVAFLAGPFLFLNRHPPLDVMLVVGGVIAHFSATLIFTFVMLTPFAFANDARAFGSPRFFVFISALIGTTYAIVAFISFRTKGPLSEDEWEIEGATLETGGDE